MRRLALNFVYIFLLGLAVSACNVEVGTTPVDAPPKPDNVPANTIWSGGPDGGVFLLVSKNKDNSSDLYHGQIYNDQTGELEYSGDLKINDNSRVIANLTDPATYAGWDGSRLYLADGRYLSALEPPQEEQK